MTHLSTVSDRTFHVTVAQTWNSLPPDISHHHWCQRSSVTSRQFCSLETTPEASFVHDNFLAFVSLCSVLAVFWLYATITSSLMMMMMMMMMIMMMMRTILWACIKPQLVLL